MTVPAGGGQPQSVDYFARHSDAPTSNAALMEKMWNSVVFHSQK